MRRKVKETTKKVARIMYGYDSRDLFIDEIIRLRNGDDCKLPLTYGGVASVMNKLGFRNRNNGELTPQFIGNVLHRYTA